MTKTYQNKSPCTILRVVLIRVYSYSGRSKRIRLHSAPPTAKKHPTPPAALCDTGLSGIASKIALIKSPGCKYVQLFRQIPDENWTSLHIIPKMNLHVTLFLHHNQDVERHLYAFREKWEMATSHYKWKPKETHEQTTDLNYCLRGLSNKPGYEPEIKKQARFFSPESHLIHFRANLPTVILHEEHISRLYFSRV